MSPLTPTLVLLLAAAAMATTTTEWAKYKLEHSKAMAINKFSDWTVEEFNNFLGYQPRPERSTGKTYENVKTPEVVDYREEGKVTPPKDQGQCGSCWAFSSTGGIEGVWAKNMGELVSVSEQQLVDCAQ